MYSTKMGKPNKAYHSQSHNYYVNKHWTPSAKCYKSPQTPLELILFNHVSSVQIVKPANASSLPARINFEHDDMVEDSETATYQDSQTTVSILEQYGDLNDIDEFLHN